jgi:hypothetical protein
MSNKKKPVKVKILAASEATDEQIASGEVGSAYSNAEVALQKKQDIPVEPLIINKKRDTSEAEALVADREVFEAQMTDAEKKAEKRRVQRWLANDLGIPFKDLDGLV